MDPVTIAAWLGLGRTGMGILSSLFGKKEEPGIAPSPIHRNILPELQALAERFRNQRNYRR